MNEATLAAVYDRLANDDELAVMLGTDDSGGLAVFHGTYNQLSAVAAGWTYPAITYRFSTDEGADARFSDSTVLSGIMDVEIWHPDSPDLLAEHMQQEAGSDMVVPRIASRLTELLHGQDLPLETGRACDVARIPGGSLDNYDDKIHQHFGLIRFRLTVLE